MKSKLSKQDLLIISITILAFLVLSLIEYSQSQLWLDEIYTFNLITDYSFSHMLTALSHDADGGFPLYYILMWGIVKTFGSSELVMRLTSSLCICISFFIIWKILRELYEFWPVAITTVFIFFTTTHLLIASYEVRFYGFFFLLCTLGLWYFLVLMNKGLGYSWVDLLLNSVIHGAMVLTHAFGFIYSGIFLLTFILSDSVQRIFRPKVYLSVILGWACFIPWIKPFIRQKDLVTPHNWIPLPMLQELSGFYSTGLVVHIPLLIILLFITNLPIYLYCKKDEYKFTSPTADSVTEGYYGSLMVVGIFFVVIPPLFAWFFSWNAVSIFLPRYMLISLLGWIIILTSLVDTILRINQKQASKIQHNNVPLTNLIYSILISGFIIFPLIASLFAKVNYADIQMYPNLPIAFTNPREYLPRAHYYPDNRRYYFILDLDASMDKKSVLNATVDYKLFEAIKKYYPQYNIVHSKEFLAQHESFLIFEADRYSQWAKKRIFDNPNYKSTPINDNIVLVEKNYNKMDNN